MAANGTTALDTLNWGTSTAGAVGLAETTSTLGVNRTDVRTPPDTSHVWGAQIAAMENLLLAMSAAFAGMTRLKTLQQTANPYSVGELGFWADTSDVPRFTTSAGVASYLSSSTGLLPGVGAVLASATTIVPTNQIHIVSGVAPIVNINTPAGFSGPLYLIPSGIWSTTAAGNIALATAATVVSKVLILVYNSATSKYYPSY